MTVAVSESLNAAMVNGGACISSIQFSVISGIKFFFDLALLEHGMNGQIELYTTFAIAFIESGDRMWFTD